MFVKKKDLFNENYQFKKKIQAISSIVFMNIKMIFFLYSLLHLFLFSAKFPALQDMMKSVMSSEMEKVVNEEK